MAYAESNKIFGKTQFTKLVAELKQLPADALPQVILAGKSNVGKSSLINKLARQKQLARSSSSAGKTRHLLFYKVAELFYLVDMPGYGFSNSSQKEQASFAKLTDSYVHSEAPIALILHLLDARHLPTAQDLQLLRWLESMGLPYVVLLNKVDKMSASQAQRSLNAIRQFVRAECELELTYRLVSAQTGQGIADLSELILQQLAAYTAAQAVPSTPSASL